MEKLKFIFQRYILTISLLLTSASVTYAATETDYSYNYYMMSFLPLEDALSTARNTPDYIVPTTKVPQNRLPLAYEKNNISIWENANFLAFILLGAVYFLLANKQSKPRGVSL